MQALGQTRDPPCVIVTANWVLAAQFALQLRIPVPVQRPHGLYVNQTWSPVPTSKGHQRVMMTRVGQWARQSGIALLEMIWAFVKEEQKGGKNNFPFELVFLSVSLR